MMRSRSPGTHHRRDWVQRRMVSVRIASTLWQRFLECVDDHRWLVGETLEAAIVYYLDHAPEVAVRTDASETGANHELTATD